MNLPKARRWIWLLLPVTYIVAVWHSGTLANPRWPLPKDLSLYGKWIPKSEAGINQLVLTGPAFERGAAAGRFTSDLLYRQEASLTTQMGTFFPSFIQKPLFWGFAWFFRGIENTLDPWMLNEMYGVSLSTSKEFDYLAEPYTRQLAYHGLHEVGQFFIDTGLSLSCTAMMAPTEKGWAIGRNFDFEGGRIFDEEKIIKWVFPTEGLSYVSVIWAGMVGAVTGVNEAGLYVNLNSAGTSEYRRMGIPSTLLITKVLQEARTIAEAKAIFERVPSLLTDIFILVAPGENPVVVEKTPQRTRFIEVSRPLAVANHLTHADFAEDKVNRERQMEFTTLSRQFSAQMELERWKQKGLISEKRRDLLSIMRLKKLKGSDEVLLGHRGTPDPLIAAHGAIYTAETQELYVSTGPSLSGTFIGYDLKASFKEKGPVRAGELPSDPLVTPEKYAQVHRAIRHWGKVQKAIAKRKCSDAKALWDSEAEAFKEHYLYFETLGDLEACAGRSSEARVAWKRALSLLPATLKEKKRVEGKLAGR